MSFINLPTHARHGWW